MSTSKEVSEYCVLYYKRKNGKKHSSKGVSKLDGSLRVCGKQVTLVCDDSGEVVCRKILSELGQRELEADEVLKLGAFEVQVFQKTVDVNSNQSIASLASLPPQKSTKLKKTFLKRRPLHPSRPPLPEKPSTNPEAISTFREEKQNLVLKKLKRPLLSSFTLSRPKLRKRSPIQETKITNMFPNAVGSIDVPHSIQKVLKSHQISGVEFLWNCLSGDQKGAILADEMGLGKTLMTIAVICALHRQKRDRKFVVVCPSSLVQNWAKEFDKWIGRASKPYRTVIRKGGPKTAQKLKCYMQRSEILILSYDLFRLNAPLLQQTTKIQLLVVDEGHRLKNTAGSQTMKALQDLPTKSRLCITATPIQNILSDVYTLGQFACPGVLGTLADFRSKYERPITAGSVKSASIQTKLMAARASKRLEQVASTFLLRRLQKDVLKTMLPPRQELLLFCRPSVLQCQMYRRLSREVEQKKSEALTTLTQLRKLCLHPSLLREGTTSRYAANNIQSSGKVVVLDSLLQHIRTYAPQDKVVVVSNYTSALSFVETNILQPRGFSFMRLDGTTPLAARQGLVDTFNASQSYFCFLLSSKAGGCGLNLVGANRLVMLDPDWNPASDIQAMARVYRQGQTKPCWIYRLFTSGTVEEVICQRQLQKKNQQLEASSAKLKFSKDELQDCFTLKQKTNCDTKDKLGASWPIYTGIANLAWEHGPDTPLQAVSNDYSIPLTHVHLAVEQEETPKVMDAILDNASIPSDDDNIDDEQEFKLEFDDLPITQKKAPQALADVSIASSCSSEQEFEF